MGSSAQDKSTMAKFDPTEVKIIIVRVPGGEVPPVPALAPKVGPHKLSPKSVGEDLCKATKDWKGMNVTCKLLVQNRKDTVQVVPSATALIIKALKEPPRDRKKVKNISHDGNLSWDDIFAVDEARRVQHGPRRRHQRPTRPADEGPQAPGEDRPGRGGLQQPPQPPELELHDRRQGLPAHCSGLRLAAEGCRWQGPVHSRDRACPRRATDLGAWDPVPPTVRECVRRAETARWSRASGCAVTW